MSLVRPTNLNEDETRTDFSSDNEIIDLTESESFIHSDKDIQPKKFSFNENSLIFDNIKYSIMPELEIRIKWIKENPGSVHTDEIKFERNLIRKFKNINELTKEELKKAVLIYLKSFPNSWTGDIITRFDLDIKEAIEILKELQTENKIKLRGEKNYS